MALTKIDDRGLKTPIDLLDSEKIRFGTGNDLEIYHDGSHSKIKQVGTGNLNLYADTFKIVDNSNGDNMINANRDGAVELYYDGVRKAYTNSGGFALDSHLIMGDGDIVKLGNGADLQIFHDGSNSYLRDATAGHLRIENDNIRLRNGASNETMLTGTVNDSVQLYFDNSKKFETTADGIFVKNSIKLEETSGSEYYLIATNSYGGLEFQNETTKVCELTDSNTLDFPDNNKIQLGTGSDLQIYHNGTHSYIVDAGTGGININADNLWVNKADGTETLATFNADGAVELYYDHSKKFETTSTGLKSESSSDLNIHLLKTGVQDTLIQNTGQTEICAATGGASGQRIVFRIGANTGSMPEIARFTPDGLCFGSDTAAANAINDYEEGVFDVTFTNGTPWTSYNKLSYTKIGNQVNVLGQFRIATAANTGTLEISNLPFTVASQSEGEFYSPPAIYISDIDLSSDTKWVSGYANAGTTILKIRGMADNTSTQEVRGTADGYIMINVTYRAA